MLGSLIAAFATGEAFTVARRVRRAAVVYAGAALLALAGIGFLAGAAYAAAARRLGTIEAALAFGVGLLVLAGLVVAVHAVVARMRRRSVTEKRNADLAAMAGVAAVSLLPALLRGRAGIGGIVGPALAVLAYAIYREHAKGPGDDTPD